MHDVWQERWEVQSMTDGAKTYIVARKQDGTMGCSCPAWKFHKAPKVNCKHIIGILEALVSVVKASRRFLDGNSRFGTRVDASTKFPSREVVDEVIGRVNFEMQTEVKGERFRVSRRFLEE